MDTYYRDALAEGFARPNECRTADTFEVPLALSIVPNDDMEAAADMVRPMLALYIGGMGAREMNFHFEVFARMGLHLRETESVTASSHIFPIKPPENIIHLKMPI
jgi:hypothetical protein